MNKTADLGLDARNSEIGALNGVRAAKKLALLVTILGLVGTAALADPFTYYQGGSGTTHVYDTGTVQPGQVTKTGRLRNTSYSDQAFICQGGRNCTQILCSACHAQPDNTKVTLADLKKHAEVYYPRAEVRLTEGQTITFAGMKLRRRKASDRMEFIDRNNRRYTLPEAAMLVKDKGGNPSLLFVPGNTLSLKADE